MIYSIGLLPTLFTGLPRVVGVIIACVIAYLLGSICFSYLVARRMKGINILEHGSGNPGTSNMLRVVGKGGAVLTLAGDLLKGTAAVYIGGLLGGGAGMLLCAGFALLGHVYPVFYKFKGGKAVATAAGCMLALDWRIFLTSIGVFAIILFVTRYISVASITAATACAVSSLFFGSDMFIYILCFGLAVLVIFKHRANLQRLFSGTENKISFHRKKG